MGGDGEDILSAGYGDNVDGGDQYGGYHDVLFISFQGASIGVTLDMALASQTIGGGTIKNVLNAGWIEGSQYDDTLTGSSGTYGAIFNVIYGMGGNDHLIAGYSTGSLYGGDGNDLVDGRGSQYLNRVFGGAGDDTLYASTSTTTYAYGDDGNDVIYGYGRTFGGAGNDTIMMTTYYNSDFVHGDDGDDDINAAVTPYNYPASDPLYGDGGDDTLHGGAGNDVLNGGAGNDRIIGGPDTSTTASLGSVYADMAIYSGKSTDYKATEDPETHLITLKDLRAGSPDGTDTLDLSVELLKFSDGIYLIKNVVAGIGLGVTNLVGSGRPDTFIGNEDDNKAKGNGGNDTLNGNGGSDVLEGDAGSDLLVGGRGEDTLYSNGSLGNWSPPYYNNIYVAPRLDRVAEIDTLNGGSGNDQISAGYGDKVDGGEGFDTLFISFQGASSGVTFDMTLESQAIGGSTITNIENADWIEGSEYADVITDGSRSYYGGKAVIFGMGGNDQLYAAYYTSNLYGGNGDDVVDGRNSQYLQRVDGGDGNDTLYTSANTFAAADGGAGDDVIHAQDTVFGGAGNDTIYMVGSPISGAAHGDDGDDRIDGSTALSAYFDGDGGDDTLIGSVNTDVLEGGAGNDVITGDRNSSDPTGDVAVYSGARTDYQVSEDAGTHLITVSDLRGGAPDGIDTLDNTIESLRFSDGTFALDDLLSGTGPVPDNFVGDGGNDGYAGNRYDNTAVGNGGDDVLGGKTGNDTIEGDSGADSLDGGAGNDALYSDAPVGYYITPYYEGYFIIPSLDRGNQVDALTGSDGDDTLSAGFGDNVDGGDGSDTLFISFQGSSAGVNFDLKLASQVIGGGTIQNIESAGWIEGSEHNDTITDMLYEPYNLSSTIFGMGGDDSIVGGYMTGDIRGGDGNDVIDTRLSQSGHYALGGAGNDTFYAVSNAYGNDGNDLFYVTRGADGGAGDDTFVTGYSLYGGAVIYGGEGFDSLTGGNGNDVLDGGDGNDTITGGADNGDGETTGDTVIYSGNRADYQVREDVDTHLVTLIDLRGGSPDGSDTLDHTIELVRFADGTMTLADALAGVVPAPDNFYGNGGNDSYVGNLNNNTAVGNGGDDVLVGRAGSDTIQGDGGADTLDGGTGNDILSSDAPTGYFFRPWYGNPYTTPVLDRGSDVDALTGGAGDDILSAGYGDSVDGGSGSDRLLISFQGASIGVKFDLSLSSQVIGGGTIQNIESAEWIEGSEYNDTITDGNGSPYADFGPIFGMGGNDSLVAGDYTGNVYGGEGNDTLDGRGAGYGYGLMLYGGAGNDVYLGGGYMIEAEDEGTDTVISENNFTLSDNFENLTLKGASATHATGNQLANLITGNGLDNWLSGLDGNDRLVGGIGNDTLIGGTGNDTFFIDAVGDAVVEQSGEGTDLIYSYVSYTLGDNFEDLTLTGSYATDATGNQFGNLITGNGLNNLLTGLDGNDRLVGGIGNDTMIGGTGNDTFFIDAVGDAVVEQSGEGTDLIYSYISYTLGDNLERLALAGTAVTDGTGNQLDNIISGNAKANHLSGLGGNDRLDGGTGNDTMTGGSGNDTYVWSDGDVLIELPGEGTDAVIANANYVLSGGFENLTLTGAALLGSGTAVDNVLTGNDHDNILRGFGGNDRLIGGLGKDGLFGGMGNDTYWVKAGDYIRELAGQGVDTAYASTSFSLAAGQEIESLILTGTGNNSATGNEFANSLTGNAGDNRIIGGLGGDTMEGGNGNDTYYLDNSGDIATDSGTGVDLVISTVDVYLSAHIENVTLTGSDSLGAWGNDLSNRLSGNGGNNTLDGGVGADTMNGGAGNDSYYIDSSGDRVGELAGAGWDAVYASVSYGLGSEVEDLFLIGTGDLSAGGNALTNHITGNDGSNRINGGAGNDTLTGGHSADTFIFLAGSGLDLVSDFSAVEGDRIHLRTYSNKIAYGGGITIVQTGADTVIDLGGGNIITVQHAAVADVTSHIIW